MSANISEEVFTSKRQGLSEEERLRERERAQVPQARYKNRLRDVTYSFQIEDIRICMGLTIIFSIR